MFNKFSLDALVQQLIEVLPTQVQTVKDEVQNNFQYILAAGLTRMHLVTREEFDAQSAVLQQTREQLRLLEQQVATQLAKREKPTR